MFLLTATASLVGGALTLVNWRYGVVAVILLGASQDAVRKLTPGAPAYFILWAFALFLFVFAVAAVDKRIGSLRLLYLRDAKLRAAWQIFAFVVIVQAAHAFLRWASVPIPILGLIFYFGPVVGLLFGAAYGNSAKRIKQFLVAYVVIMVPAALTVYLSLWYSESIPLLQEIGEFTGGRLMIYDVGTVLYSYPGVFRTGEIAAWHAATAASFLFILASMDRSTARRVIAGVLIVLLIGAILLTGRRKMLATLAIFLSVNWALLALFRRGAVRQAVWVVALGVLGAVGLTLFERGSTAGLYVQRGASVFGDTTERFGTAVQLMMSAINRSGGLGFGAGVASQGARFAGGSGAVIGGSGEAGLGKIVVELGIPGALAVLWLVAMLANRFWRSFGLLARTDQRLVFFAASFAAFLVANLGTFLVAQQVYGDPFVLVVLGLTAGFLFSVVYAGVGEYRQMMWLRQQRRALRAA